MKNLSLSLILVCLTLQIGFSQTNPTNVKRQYIDTANTATTVVVKQDSASDLDVLNTQFDINNISMGEVIFIKTEDLAPTKPKSERTSFDQMGEDATTVQESTKPARTVAAQPAVVKTPAKAATSSRPKAARPQLKSKSIATASNINTAKAKKATTTAKPEVKRPQKYFGVGSSYKKKMKKKKLKRRKRVRRSHRNKCFSF